MPTFLRGKIACIGQLAHKNKDYLRLFTPRKLPTKGQQYNYLEFNCILGKPCLHFCEEKFRVGQFAHKNNDYLI